MPFRRRQPGVDVAAALESEVDRIDAWGARLAQVLLGGGRLLAVGNGGSAAQAQHLTAELVGRYTDAERAPLSALALSAETPSVTAIGNDYGIEAVFARQVRAHGRAGDVLIALSTSGSSANVVAAVEAALAEGLTTWALTGPRPNPVSGLCDDALCVQAPSAATVQEIHQVVLHLLCAAVDRAVGSARAGAVADRAGGGERALTLPRPDLFGEPAGEGAAEAVARRVREQGGTVVATGGCFDLLHAGHVSTLRSARTLGDCLIVCLNSDASVRRLKGPDRPLVPQADRAAVLGALACVDAVAVFDEDTPEALLDRLRPDVFAKGGDYAAEELPETALLASWGGRTVILPYIEGRSTTRLLEEMVLRGLR